MLGFLNGLIFKEKKKENANKSREQGREKGENTHCLPHSWVRCWSCNLPSACKGHLAIELWPGSQPRPHLGSRDPGVARKAWVREEQGNEPWRSPREQGLLLWCPVPAASAGPWL